MGVYLSEKDFDDFWKAKGQYLRVKNNKRTYNNLIKKIEEYQDSEKLDFYVCSAKNGKETIRQIIVEFYNYLGRKGQKPESVLYDKRFYDLPIERQLEIAKFLHTPKSPAEIQERFDIDQRTMREDLEALETGITVLGSTIQISKEKQGRKYYYHTTLHPVFLPLNLTEVYTMTVYLDRIIKDYDINAEIIRGISDRVKAQLSDYALDKLYPDKDVNYLRNKENRYYNDKLMAMQRENIKGYLMKSGHPCKFMWKGEEYIGSIRYNTDNKDYQIQLESGEFIDADLHDVDFVLDGFEYR